MVLGLESGDCVLDCDFGMRSSWLFRGLRGGGIKEMGVGKGSIGKKWKGKILLSLKIVVILFYLLNGKTYT